MKFTTRNQVATRGFFRDKSLDFQARGLLGRTSSRAAEVGEVLATLARISNHAQWSTEWSKTARIVQGRAETARAAGHLVSAGEAYLQAATYWAAAVDGITASKDSSALLPTFRSHRACWDGFIDSSAGAHVRVEVPYEGTTLPGYLLRPDATGTPRPTFIMTNGSDGSISDLWGSGAAGALARGWNAFVYDGPGQQSMLFEHELPFRHDWEQVLTPVVDTLAARDDVDADQLVAYGISQAGYWLPRALAFEHRIVAAVADPGVVDVATSWNSGLSDKMRAMLDTGDRATFNRNMRYATMLPGLRRTLTFRGRPYQHKDWFDLFTAVRQYRLEPEIAARITTPLLITSPEDEQFWPGQSQQLADLLPGRADLVAFTAAEGANFHCQPEARLLTDQRMFDWLADQLARTQPTRTAGASSIVGPVSTHC